MAQLLYLASDSVHTNYFKSDYFQDKGAPFSLLLIQLLAISLHASDTYTAII